MLQTGLKLSVVLFALALIPFSAGPGQTASIQNDLAQASVIEQIIK
ncbi:MAG: hypothetical protein IH612_14370, partial [Desulfofustis sp.]|nr:hypothetical protein [Desulfofustis sp.]